MISAIMPTYKRFDVCFEKGEGVFLYDTNGKRYLDFASGIAVNAFGHAHPEIVAALTEQAHKLWHVSNFFYNLPVQKLAETFVKHTFADTVFFANSGTEAVECAIKTARKYHAAQGQPERFHIISFEGAFHGRTLASLAAAGKKEYLEGFGEPLSGFSNVPFGDIDAVKAAITPQTAAIIIEPIQGEGGVRVASAEFLKQLRTLCDEQGLLLIFDEVQVGMGRTGKLFAYEHFEITPDIISVAKGIGAGFPLGACLATERAACGMGHGTHGTTYGGNPLATAIGQKVLDLMLEKGFFENVEKQSSLLFSLLEKLQAGFPELITEIRGQGLIIGLKITDTITAKDFVQKGLDYGLVLAPASDNVVRLLPPLIIQEHDCEYAYTLLTGICQSFAQDLS